MMTSGVRRSFLSSYRAAITRGSQSSGRTIPIKGSRPTGQASTMTMPASPLHRVVRHAIVQRTQGIDALNNFNASGLCFAALMTC